jgi:hypothetical protein
MDQTKIPLRELFLDLANDLVIVIDPDPFAEGAEPVGDQCWLIRNRRRGELVDQALVVTWEMGSDFRYGPLMDIAPENDDLPEIVTIIHHREE